jgi:hypothetical protein
MRFLFWNIKNNPAGRLLSGLTEEHNIDVLILAECSDEAGILNAINMGTRRTFHLTWRTHRIVIYTRFPREFAEMLENAHDRFLAVGRLKLPGRTEVLLAAIHFPSKRYMSPSDQKAMSRHIAEEIRRVETRVGHSRTLLVGDLNMNPFEDGMISADGFHAVMTLQLANKEARSVQGNQYPFFYNPMWGLFGDNSEGPPGTFYRSASSFVEYFWHIFDQVLIRPSLLRAFDLGSLRVLTECRGESFLDRNGIPDRARGSDHLPILFNLNI